MAQQQHITNAQLPSVLQFVPGAAALCKPDGQIEYANEAFSTLFGVNEDNSRLSDYVTSHSIDQLLKLAGADESSREIEVSINGSDGRSRPVLLLVNPVSNDEEPHFVLQAYDLDDHYFNQRVLTLESSILRLVTGGADIKTIFKQVATVFEESIPGSRCIVSTLDVLNGLSLHSSAGIPAGLLEGLKDLALGDPFYPCVRAIEHSTETSEPLTPDNSTVSSAYKELCRDNGIMHSWSVPFYSSNSNVLGTICILFDRLHEPGRKERFVMERIGTITGLACDRLQAASELNESRERYHLAIRGANDGIWDYLIDKEQVYYSARFNEITGRPKRDSSGTLQEWLDLVVDEDRDKFTEKLENHLAGNTNYFQLEYRTFSDDGKVLWVLVRGLALRDQSGHAYRIAGSLTDITSRKAIENLLQYEALHDRLTGLPNRSLLLNRLKQNLEIFQRDHTRLFAVLFIDLDRFKVINDSLGHMAGDHLLFEMASNLKHSLRPGDTLARLGGDEFVILLTNIDGLDAVFKISQRILETVRQPIQYREHEWRTAASIGIAVINPKYEKAEDMLRDADAAMYRAKSEGRGRVAIFDSDMHEKALMRLRLEKYIRETLDSDGFSLHYSPLINLKTRQPELAQTHLAFPPCPGAEASFGRIVRIAEESGLIHRLGRWSLKSVMKYIKDYPAGVPAVMPVSHLQFKQSNFTAQVERELKVFNNRPQDLVLQISEHVFVNHEKEAIARLTELAGLGVKTALFGSGSGYSSIGYLKAFNFDFLKLKTDLITDLSNERNLTIFNAIVNLARSLDMQVIVEGIENRKQYDYVAQSGASFAGGNYTGSPLDAQPFIDLYHSR